MEDQICSQGLYHVRAIWLCSNRCFVNKLSLLSWFVVKTWFINPCNPSPMPKRLKPEEGEKTSRGSVSWQKSKPHASSVNLWLHQCIEEEYPLEESWRSLLSISQASQVAVTTVPNLLTAILKYLKGCVDWPTWDSFSPTRYWQLSTYRFHIIRKWRRFLPWFTCLNQINNQQEIALLQVPPCEERTNLTSGTPRPILVSIWLDMQNSTSLSVHAVKNTLHPPPAKNLRNENQVGHWSSQVQTILGAPVSPFLWAIGTWGLLIHFPFNFFHVSFPHWFRTRLNSTWKLVSEPSSCEALGNASTGASNSPIPFFLWWRLEESWISPSRRIGLEWPAPG